MARKKSVRESESETSNNDTAIVTRWLKEIELAQGLERQQQFENFGDRVLRIFTNKPEMDAVGTGFWQANVMFNVLWSNVQVLEPALYSRMPKVVVERVFKDSDPVGRMASEICERSTHFNLMRQQDSFNYAMSNVVKDRLLPGRGTGNLIYSRETTIATDPETGDPIEENEQPILTTKPNSEKIEFRYRHWLDYLESPARTQEDVRWRAVKIWMTRAELVKEFGAEIGNCVELGQGTKSKRPNANADDDAEFLKQAAVWVVEDITSKNVIWVSEGYRQGPLKMLHDPYKIRGFWTFPIPLVATTTSDSTIPIADYVIYKGMADELNYVASRLKGIVNCIRLVGAHAKAFDNSLREIMQQPDGMTKPVADWASFSEKSGFKGVIDWVPFEQCVAAVPVLSQYQAELKAQIDEITSMPDIVRGSSDPNDPVYTQQQKSHWTVIKLVKKQQDVQRFCREVISKMAQMIFEPGFFTDETIYLMAGVGQMPPEKQELFYPALQLLRDDRLNTFRIDIETDSTIAIDESDAANRWFEYMRALQELIGTVQNTPPDFIAPVLETALQAARQLRTGRSVEGSLEKALEDVEAQIKQQKENPQPPPPDPAIMKAQVDQQKVQIEGMKAQQNGMLEQRKQEFSEFLELQKLQLDGTKVQGDIKVRSDANMIDAGKNMSTAQIEQLYLGIQKMELDLKNRVETLKQAIEEQRLKFDEKAKGLEMTEKIMEEKRLARQDNIEVAKLNIDANTAALKAQTEMAKLKQAKEQKNQPA